MKEDSSLASLTPRVQDGAPSGEHSDAIDAARWRALMSSQRIRIMGSAGFRNVDDAWVPARADLHIGVEFWNVHSAAHPSAEFPQEFCRAQFIAYVDHVRAKVAATVSEGEEQGFSASSTKRSE